MSRAALVALAVALPAVRPLKVARTPIRDPPPGYEGFYCEGDQKCHTRTKKCWSANVCEERFQASRSDATGSAEARSASPRRVRPRKRGPPEFAAKDGLPRRPAPERRGPRAARSGPPPGRAQSASARPRPEASPSASLSQRSKTQRRRRKASGGSAVLVLAEDLRADHVFGDRATTPQLDGLAAVGVSFDRAFAQATWCAPSRASLLTGLDPFVAPLKGAENIAQTLRALGYETVAVGKVAHAAVPGDVVKNAQQATAVRYDTTGSDVGVAGWSSAFAPRGPEDLARAGKG